jgi:hypothetical protein
VKQWNEEFDKERRRVVLMKNNFGGVGKGHEDTVGATAIGASGDPMKGGGEARADDPVRPRGEVCDGPD